MSLNSKRWVVFTDLDGTLLDSQTYSYLPAVEAIEYLKNKKIPLVFCTSKTYSETLALQKELEIHAPLIVENGSALYLPQEQFHQKQPDWQETEAFFVKIFGKTRSEVVGFLKEIEREFHVQVLGFSGMDAERIRHYTGLSEERALLAQQREFSEPFVIRNGTLDVAAADAFAQKYGYRLLRGNRFYHLLGKADKGQAVKYLLRQLTGATASPLYSIGLGDSPNDEEMLKAVDYPVCIRRPDGSYAVSFAQDSCYFTRAAGPAGWAEAVFKLLD